jgi:hypothetical protein
MATPELIQAAVIKEILDYLGIPNSSLQRKLVGGLLMLPAARFARLAAEFDHQVGENGFRKAAQWLLPHFIKGYWVAGTEHIPQSGPLVIAANHPGTFDTFIIAACLPRDDIKFIARDMPLLRQLTSTSGYLIYSTRDIHVKMTAARAAIKHLRAGGALLVYPTGNMDPDPACMPGAEQSIERWSSSLELLLRNQPEAYYQTVISSGLLDPTYLRHPISRRQKDERWTQIVAEVLQLSQQFTLPRKHKLIPEVTFGEAYSLQELSVYEKPSTLSAAIAAGRKNLFFHQCALQSGLPRQINWRKSMVLTEYY